MSADEVSMVRVLGLFTCLILVNCGANSGNPYAGAVACPADQTCSFVCPTWAAAQPLGTTRYQGSRYCSAGTLYVQADRYDQFTAVAPGTYAAEQLRTPCGFTVGPACAFTEN
jgi:hypothetical protein